MAIRAAASAACVGAALVAAACGETGTSSSPSVGMPEWTAPRTVAAFDAHSSPIPRVSGRGNTIAVVWQRPVTPGDGNVEASRLGLDGAWQSSRRIGPASSAQIFVGVDRAGRSVAAWVGPDPDPTPTRLRRCAWAAAADANGTWSEPVALACDVAFLRLAVGPVGDAAVAWSSTFDPGQPTGPSRWSLWSARFRPGEGWSDLRTLGASLRELFAFEVAVDESGLGAAAWIEGTRTNADGAVYLATGHAGAPWNVSLVSPFAPGQENARVAFEAPGVPVLAWEGVGGGVRALRVTPGARVAAVTEDGNDRCISMVGSGTGASMMAWRRLSGAAFPLLAGVVAAPGGGGRWEPEQLRGFPDQRLHCPVTAIDEAGNGVVAWEETASGRAGEVWASVRYGPTGRWTQARMLEGEGGDPAVAIANGVAYVVWRSGWSGGTTGVALEESRLRLSP